MPTKQETFDAVVALREMLTELQLSVEQHDSERGRRVAEYICEYYGSSDEQKTAR